MDWPRCGRGGYPSPAWFRVMLLGLLVRILVLAGLFAVPVIGDARPSFGIADDLYYHDTAAAAAHWVRRGDWVAAWQAAQHPYARLLALIYAVTGTHPWVAQLVNAFLGSAAVGVGSVIAESLHASRQAGAAVGAALALYPSFVFHSTQLLKDASVVLAGMVAAWGFTAWVRRPKVAALGVSALALAALTELRPYVAVAAVCAGGLAAVAQAVRRDPVGVARVAAWLLVAGLVTYLLDAGPWGVGLVRSTDLDRVRPAYSQGEGAVGVARVDSPANWLVSLVHVAAAPFPWQAARGWLWTAGAVDALFCLTILAAALRHAFDRRLAPERLFVAAFAGAILSAVALFSDNVGANVRLRILPYCLLAVVAAPALWKHPGLCRLSPLLLPPGGTETRSGAQRAREAPRR